MTVDLLLTAWVACVVALNVVRLRTGLVKARRRVATAKSTDGVGRTVTALVVTVIEAVALVWLTVLTDYWQFAAAGLSPLVLAVLMVAIGVRFDGSDGAA